MTATLSMDDVRRQVMNVWCSECQAPAPCGTIYEDHKARGILRDPLFTRCRGCQPEGLVPAHDGKGGKGFTMDGRWIEPAHAVDLILMSTARDATAARESMKYGSELHYQACWCLQNLTTAIMFSKLEDAVKWRHQLKDLEDST